MSKPVEQTGKPECIWCGMKPVRHFGIELFCEEARVGHTYEPVVPSAAPVVTNLPCCNHPCYWHDEGLGCQAEEPCDCEATPHLGHAFTLCTSKCGGRVMGMTLRECMEAEEVPDAVVSPMEFAARQQAQRIYDQAKVDAVVSQPEPFYKPEPGEWIGQRTEVEWKCCGCGLVHLVKFRLAPDGQLETSMTRLASPTPVVSEQAKPTLPVGVSVLVVQGGKVLMGRRKNNTAEGLWSTPGGRVEENEDIYGCAIRETKEETGLELSRENLTFLDFREHFRYGKHYIMFYMKASGFDGEPVNTEPDKCESWEWVTTSEMPESATTEPKEILAMLSSPSLPKAGETDRRKGREWRTGSGCRAGYKALDGSWHAERRSILPKAVAKEECVHCNQIGKVWQHCHRCGAPMCSISCEEWHLEKCNPDADSAAPPLLPAQDGAHILNTFAAGCAETGTQPTTDTGDTDKQ